MECSLCIATDGPTPKGHTKDRCFINPRAPDFRLDFYQRRVAALKARGKAIPQELAELGPPPPGQNNNFRIVAEISRVVGRLDLPEEMRERVVDAIITKEQNEVMLKADEPGLQAQYSMEGVGLQAQYTMVDPGLLPEEGRLMLSAAVMQSDASEAEADCLDRLISTLSEPVVIKDTVKKQLRELIGIMEGEHLQAAAQDREVEDVAMQGEELTSVEVRKTREWGVNTDAHPKQITQTGKVLTRAKKPAQPKPLAKTAANDLTKVVTRLRLSVPLLKYAKVDKSLRALVLSTLLKNCWEEGESVVVPDGLMVQALGPKEFEKYRGVLGGVTPENEEEVATALRQLGVHE